MDYVLTVNAISKSYKRFQALKNLSMHVPKGAVYGFVGKNGSGKTTLIRLICGLQTPTSGSYALYGTENTEESIQTVRKRIGAVVETPSIYLHMTAEENLEEQYRILGLPSFDGIGEILKLAGLDNTGKKKAKHFSLGMRQRLGIAIALCGNPDFLILDEPANGLDPQGIVEIRELILKLNKERQITFLISSHILDELSRLATHYGFIDNGHIVKEISAADLPHLPQMPLSGSIRHPAFALAADQMGLEYHILSDTQAEIFSKITITKLILPLSEKGCEVLSIHEREESLESYYMSLIGGKTHE